MVRQQIETTDFETSFWHYNGSVYHSTTSVSSSGVKFLELDVRSNAATIIVKITASNFKLGETSLSLAQLIASGNLGSVGFSTYNNYGWGEVKNTKSISTTTNSMTDTLILFLGKTSPNPYYSGILYMYITNMPAWLEAGKYSFDTSFTIMPKSNY